MHTISLASWPTYDTTEKPKDDAQKLGLDRGFTGFCNYDADFNCYIMRSRAGYVPEMLIKLADTYAKDTYQGDTVKVLVAGQLIKEVPGQRAPLAIRPIGLQW